MIAFLSGRIIEKHPNRVIVDVGGVGYDVQVPLSTFYALGEPGGEVALRVHTHVREDALALFGFVTPLELALFERLISISGIGPRLALAVLSGIEPADLVRAVRGQDLARLTAIPGIGKKTAERISLELKHRLTSSIEAEAGVAPAPAAPEPSLGADVLAALLNLGYQRGPAEKAIARIVASRPDVTVEQCLREALSLLTRH
jgi:Holliday junction DNA helicase RuvA